MKNMKFRHKHLAKNASFQINYNSSGLQTAQNVWYISTMHHSSIEDKNKTPYTVSWTYVCNESKYLNCCH